MTRLAIPTGTTAAARFEVILEEYGGWLRRTLARLCPVDLGIQVEDLEQEVAMRLWRALERETEIDHPASFLYRVAATATLDAMRRARARRTKQQDALEEEDETAASRQLSDPGPSPERTAQQNQLLAAAEDLLRELPPDRRRAVRLYLRGFNAAEIADLTGWTEPRARNLLYRGLSALREALRAAGYDYQES